MTKTIEFRVPTIAKRSKKVSYLTLEGRVAWLEIGPVKHKFVIHQVNGSPRLTDYRTGGKVADLGTLKDMHVGSGSMITDREAAQYALNDIVARMGHTAILEKMGHCETVNS